MMGSWKGRGNQYLQFIRDRYCKLPTNGKQLPAFPLKPVQGIKPRGGFHERSQTWPGLNLNNWLKSEPFGSAKSLSQMVFTEGVSVETKLIK